MLWYDEKFVDKETWFKQKTVEVYVIKEPKRFQQRL